MLQGHILLLLGVVTTAVVAVEAESPAPRLQSRWGRMTSVKPVAATHEVEFKLGTRDGIWEGDQLWVYRRLVDGTTPAQGRLTVLRVGGQTAVGVAEGFVPAIGDWVLHQHSLPIPDDENHPLNGLIGTYVDLKFNDRNVQGFRYHALVLGVSVLRDRGIRTLELGFPPPAPAPTRREYLARSIQALWIAGAEYRLDWETGALVEAGVLADRVRERERLAAVWAEEEKRHAEEARRQTMLEAEREAKRQEAARIREEEEGARRTALIEATRVAARRHAAVMAEFEAKAQAAAAQRRAREAEAARSQTSSASSWWDSVGTAMKTVVGGAVLVGSALYALSGGGESYSSSFGPTACQNHSSCREFVLRGDGRCECGCVAQEHGRP